MVDVFSGKKRSDIMSRIRSKHTGPEIAVRKALTKRGLRYRLHSGQLPGKPDIIVPRLNAAIFVNGCFWHQHSNCKRKTMPKTNTEYWENKLKQNVKRQQRDIRALKKLGWKVYKIWECQAMNDVKLANRLSRIL
jgi:DNA mismatch endonuclease (patch repair protein)